MMDLDFANALMVFSDFVTRLQPLLTTFLGAGFAFLWQGLRDDRKQRQDNYGALLKMQETFYIFYNELVTIRDQYLAAHKEDKERAVKVRHISFYQKFPDLDFGGLSFILTTKNPDMFDDIVNAYRKCQSAVESIEERNRQYRKAADGAVKTADLSSDSFKVLIGAGDFVFLRDFTDIMYREVDQSIDRVKEIDEKIRRFIKENFKGKHALKAISIEEAKDGKRGV